MERIIRGRSATLTHTFYVDGVATNPTPDAATVTIIRDDGTAVITNQAATEAGTGVVTYTVTPAHTVDLDTWQVTWTATFGGQSQTFAETVEVAGDFLYTLTAAQARTPTATIGALRDARTLAEEALEDMTGVAFVPRYARTRPPLSGTGTAKINLRRPLARKVRWATIDGAAVAAGDCAAMTFAGDGRLVYAPTLLWNPGYGNVVIGFEHGMDRAPLAVSEAALSYSASLLAAAAGAGVDPRAERLVTDDGTLIFDASGVYLTGMPAVDRVVAGYGIPNVA